MKLLKTLYDTVWLKMHPVSQDENGRGLYPSWRAAWDVARIIASAR